MVDINDFTQEKICTYKGETYHVRDNGAVMRETKGNKKRPLDEEWTFGKKNESNGYMTIGGHRVHIIVATAFHGSNDSKVYVVDHIDTNRCNNRPENLRWLTKLENVLLNDITRNKIEFICGSIESFLKNPSQLNGYESLDNNFKWMRSVTKEEAENTLKNWKYLLEKPRVKTENHESIDEWLYGSYASKQYSPTNDKVSKELSKQLNAERKRQEREEIKRKQMENKSTIIKQIISIANIKKWNIKENVKGNGWTADLVIENTNGNSIGIVLYKKVRDLEAEQNAMKDDGVKGCWLECSTSSYSYDNSIPSFCVEFKGNNIKVVLSNDLSVSLTDLLVAMMSDKLRIKDKITVKKIKVRFIPVSCYWCEQEHYIYCINGVICDECPSLATYDGMYDNVYIDKFDPLVVKSVNIFLSKHPELNYIMGDIKERYSKTRDTKYMSFGCPKCDGLLGDFYLSNIVIDYMYEKDDEFVHIVDLNEEIKRDYKHWIIG